MTDTAELKMDAAALDRLMAAEFPQSQALGYRIERVAADAVDLRLPMDDRHLRPGGTVSGPTLFTLADMAMYLHLLSRLGPVALAVTTDVTLHFLRRPKPRDVLARAEMLKLGRRLAVGQVLLRSDGDAAPIAHAVLTYSIPPAR
jgi:uncharacterized protein (TIGR00369 family)